MDEIYNFGKKASIELKLLSSMFYVLPTFAPPCTFRWGEAPSE